MHIPLKGWRATAGREGKMKMGRLPHRPDEGAEDRTTVVGLLSTLDVAVRLEERVEAVEVRSRARTHQIDRLGSDKYGRPEHGHGGSMEAEPQVERNRDQGKDAEGEGEGIHGQSDVAQLKVLSSHKVEHASNVRSRGAALDAGLSRRLGSRSPQELQTT